MICQVIQCINKKVHAWNCFTTFVAKVSPDSKFNSAVLTKGHFKCDKTVLPRGYFCIYYLREALDAMLSSCSLISVHSFPFTHFRSLTSVHFLCSLVSNQRLVFCPNKTNLTHQNTLSQPSQPQLSQPF